jgi:hypothetical protein
MMKGYLIFFFALLSFNLLADEIKVEINPTRPVAGEVFQAIFRVFTSTDEEPSVNFTPANIEVVGKSNQGLSTRTIYANGKLTVTREITIVYDLISAKPGAAYLRDINVQVGSSSLRHSSVNLNILKEAEDLAEVFVLADVPKKDLYQGEGIIVRYYLYSKVPISNIDIKKYPKLNHFLKRFLQEPERTERVSVDGDIYMRTQIYAAKLYPEKTGELKIDSLQISATYPNSASNDPFGSFGLNRDFRTRSIRSEVIKIQVRPLPMPAPADFTGLVGIHDFQLQTGQNKLIVNEPLEIKLTITGVGALENLEAPELLKHPGLEEFESNGDLKISSADQATKVFDYTYLAKENLSLAPKDIVLSYFDPHNGRYVPTTLKLPEIVVAGGGAVQIRKEDTKLEDSTPKQSNIKSPAFSGELTRPVLFDELNWKRWIPFINLSLISLVILISLGWVIRSSGIKGVSFKNDVPAKLRRKDFEFSEFVQWMGPLIKEYGKPPSLIIKESPLSFETKKYFIDLLSANDYKEYSLRKSKMDYKYIPNYYKELAKYIKSTGRDT